MSDFAKSACRLGMAAALISVMGCAASTEKIGLNSSPEKQSPPDTLDWSDRILVEGRLTPLNMADEGYICDTLLPAYRKQFGFAGGSCRLISEEFTPKGAGSKPILLRSLMLDLEGATGPFFEDQTSELLVDQVVPISTIVPAHVDNETASGICGKFFIHRVTYNDINIFVLLAPTDGRRIDPNEEFERAC